MIHYCNNIDQQYGASEGPASYEAALPRGSQAAAQEALQLKREICYANSSVSADATQVPTASHTACSCIQLRRQRTIRWSARVHLRSRPRRSLTRTHRSRQRT